MSKLPETRIPPPGFAACKTPFSPVFAKAICQFPGVSLQRQGDFEGWWLIPTELVSSVEKLAMQRKVRLAWIPAAASYADYDLTSVLLLPFQREGAAVGSKSPILLNYEPGLGKTPTAIEAIKLANAFPALVICPANVRRTWKSELIKWGWAGDVILIETGSDWDLYVQPDYTPSNTIVITSYELSHLAPLYGWAALILDEAHKIKNRESSFAKTALALRDTNPTALRLALTATPYSNDPSDLYSIADWLYPGRLGNYWHYVTRYCVVEKNDFGTRLKYRLLDDGTWTCLLPERLPELKARFNAFTLRATRQEVGHLLPAFTVTALRQRSGEKLSSTYEDWAIQGPINKHRAESDILALHGEKTLWAATEVKQAHQSEHHVCVLTHLKETARAIRDSLREETGIGEILYLDGEVSTKKRDKLLEASRRLPRSTLVATMHSVLEGVNSLTQFTTAIYAELYYSPRVMIQSLGRFSRLNSVAPSRALLLVLEGTLDEAIALSVLRKVQTANRIFTEGQGEAKLVSALALEETEEDFFASLREVAKKGMEDAY